MAEEMRFHLDERIADNLADGLPPDEARYVAQRRFGNLGLIQETARDQRGWTELENSLRDVRFACRQLAKSPSFTAVAVLTLALGIGANSAIFSVINSALLKPLPYPHADQIVDVLETQPDGRPNGSVSGGAFKDWVEHSTRFAHLAVYEDIRRNLTGTGAPERVTGLQASAGFLSVLGIEPLVGRDFDAKETSAGGNTQVILLTHQFWQSHFAGDAGVVGSKVSLDQTPYTVIGVLPPRALYLDNVQFLIPEVIDAPNSYWGRDAHWRQVIGRLLPGITASEAQTELRGIKQQLNAQYPSWKAKWSVSVTSLQEILVGNTRPIFTLLLGAVALVLLIACANVSNLLLARGNARSREMAVRMALGAQSSRIVRQMLTESLLLALAGCALGLLFAAGSMRLSGRGVSWCATCDGFFYRQKTVAVVGGGDSAMEEANFLTRFADKVVVIHRRDSLRASKIMVDRAHANPKIEFVWNTEVIDVLGEQSMTALKLKNVATGEESERAFDGLFVAIGHSPRSELLGGQVDLDSEGYVKVDGRSTRTNLAGVFACGDLVDHTYRQAITAAGTGCEAALDAERFLAGH